MNKLWVGIDWGDTRHAVCAVDGQGIDALAFEVPHTSEGLSEIVERLRAGEVAGVAVETPRNPLVQKLLEAGFAVYPVNPKVSKAWRQGWKAAEGKTDASDARVLADGLRHHHARLAPLAPGDPKTRELGMLCADESGLIAERTALVNRLKAALKEYYPAALGWFGDWTSPAAWDFVIEFDRPGKLAAASKKKLIGFLKTRKIGLRPVWIERIERRKEALEWPCDPAAVEARSMLAVSLAKQLKTLDASLKAYRGRIEALYSERPDSEIFSSLPGAGGKLAPRLLAEFGEDRELFESAEALKKLSGCVPVTEKSGRLDVKKFRRSCRKGFRNTMHLFAFQSTMHSAWARAFYDNCKARGQSHNLALRNLAAKWIKIIWRMWRDGKPYDEQVYVASLIKHGSPLAAELGLSEKM